MTANHSSRRTWRSLALLMLPMGVMLCGAAPVVDGVTEGQGGGAQPTLRIASAPVTAPHPLAGVASIIEATVSTSYQKYDPDLGPRTYFVLSSVVVHAGAAPDSNEFSHLGGKTPAGEEMVVFDVPRPVEGQRYIMFISAKPWVYSPIWSGLLFAVQETPSGGFVVGPNGRVVTSASKAGVAFGETVSSGSSAPPTTALPKADFIAAMAHAAAEVQAPLGAVIQFKPTVPWKVTNTSRLGEE